MSELDSRELSEWIAYNNIEPFGEERADLRQAITSALIANQWKGKDAPAAKPLDFMPYSKPPVSPEQSQDDMTGRLTALHELLKGKRGNT